jgi:hypothetical protein
MKSVHVPNLGQSQIVALKFAKYDENQFLLVFMSEGQILCLDTIIEQFVRAGESFVIQQTLPQASVDLKTDLCLCVDDSSHGVMYRVEVSDKTVILR